MKHLYFIDNILLIFVITLLLVCKVCLFFNFGFISSKLIGKVVSKDYVRIVERGCFFFFTGWFLLGSFRFGFDILNCISLSWLYVLTLLYISTRNACNVVKKILLLKNSHIFFRIFTWGIIIKLIIQLFLSFFTQIYFIFYGSNKNNILYFYSRCSEVNRRWFSNNRFSRCRSWYWNSLCWINSRFIKEPSFLRFVVSLCYFRFCINRSNGFISDYDGVLDFEQLNHNLRFFFFKDFLINFFYKYEIEFYTKSSLAWFMTLYFLMVEQIFDLLFKIKYKSYDA